MKIGTRVSPDWLDRPDDLKFLKQIGVDCVDITLDMCPGYTETGGRTNREGLQMIADKLDEAGLVVERANCLSSNMKGIYLGTENTDRELDHLVNNVTQCGEVGFPVVGVQCFSASQFPGLPETETHSFVEGRGGYRHLRVDVAKSQGHPTPEGAPTADEIWERTLAIYRAVVPAAETVGTRIAMHGNDPPVREFYGVPQVLYDFDCFDRLFTEVPSDHSGMTFCVGTRYESGQDVFEGIRRFGGKIFHVHFRNVQGRIPDQGWYAEGIPDAGDLNMFEVARALKEAGYTGALDYDHIMQLVDDEGGRSYIAYCVGHTRGILQALDALG